MGVYAGGLTNEGNVDDELRARRTHATSTPGEGHLRSSNAVIGHHIEATDGGIGHVEDLLVDDRTWAITHLIVSTSNWRGGHRVLVAQRWIKDVSWSEAKVSVELTREAVKDAPRCESIAQLDRQPEQGIHEYDGRARHSTTPPPQERQATRPDHAVHGDAGGGSHEAATSSRGHQDHARGQARS